MAIVERRSPEETRGCILSVAWDLFRQLGTRTTVADIADKSGMSSANVYRFFPSKQALSEAVCESLLGEMLKVARRELDAPGTAAQRIAGMMLALHRLMRDQMTDDARAHEIVKIAVDEVWPPIVDYLHKCAGMLAEAIAEGQAGGEFAHDRRTRDGALSETKMGEFEQRAAPRAEEVNNAVAGMGCGYGSDRGRHQRGTHQA